MTDRRRRAPAKGGDGLAGFYVMVNGQVESAEFRGLDNMFCRYTFSYGPDWRIVQGVDHGFSQVAQKGAHADASVVWNFPLDVTFKATNAHGWPRLVLSVYSQDLFGRYVIRGYGSVLIPTVPGKYTRYVRTFAPVSSTYLQGFLGWMTGHLPEFYDSRFVASNEGREVVRVASTGVVRVQFNVMSRGMHSHGYSTGGPPDAPDLDAEVAFAAGLQLPSAAQAPAPAVATTSRFADLVAQAAAKASTARVQGAFAPTTLAGTVSAATSSSGVARPPVHAGDGARAAGSSTERDSASSTVVERVGESGGGGAGRVVKEVEAVEAGGGARQRSSSRRRLAAVDEEEERAGRDAGASSVLERDRPRDRDRDGSRGAGARRDSEEGPAAGAGAIEGGGRHRRRAERAREGGSDAGSARRSSRDDR